MYPYAKYLTALLGSLLLIPPVSVAHQRSPVTVSQASSLDSAAAQVAAFLLHHNRGQLIVFNFYNSDGSLSALGPALADKFSAALAREPHHPRVKARAELTRLVAREHFDPVVLTLQGLDGTLAQELGLKSYIQGVISPKSDSLEITVKARTESFLPALYVVRFSLPLTKEIAGPLSHTIASPPNPPFFDPDRKQISAPKCIHCPRARYTHRAMKHKTQGAVVLEAIITTGGRLSGIRVLKSLPDGLTESSLRAARAWKLLPAKGPGGQPIEVRETVVMKFQLFRIPRL